MISIDEQAHIDSMDAQAKELGKRCASARPECLPQHELAYYIMDNHFPFAKVMWAAWILVAFVAIAVLLA